MKNISTKIEDMNVKRVFNMTADEVLDAIRKELWHKDCNIADVYNKFIAFAWCGASSIYTVRNKYTAIRKEITESRLSKTRKTEFLNIFKLDESINKALNNMQNEALNVSTADINKQNLDVNSYLKGLLKLKDMINNEQNHKPMFDQLLKQNGRTKEQIRSLISAVYLLMNTGRRSVEIFSTLIIDEARIENEKVIVYEDLVKKRGRGEPLTEAFPVDYDIKTLKKALENVRAFWSQKMNGKPNSYFNNNYSKNINNFVKKFMNEYKIIEDDNLTLKDFRDMYATVAVMKYKKEKEINKDILRGVVLGHEPISKLPASFNYDKYRAEDVFLAADTAADTATDTTADNTSDNDTTTNTANSDRMAKLEELKKRRS